MINRESITDKVLQKKDETGCWNVLKPGDKWYPQFNYYSPNYNSTLWTLILLADIGCDPSHPAIERPLKRIVQQFYDTSAGIFSIGESHYPIPCLNGNMVYLLSYFQWSDSKLIDGVVDFFTEHQRFDDGEKAPPKSYPFHRNRSCYGKHTCYWGVVKLLKGLSFIPMEQRSPNGKALLSKCIDYILLHRVCYSSHRPEEFLHTNIKKLSFPHMYQSDFLEILWLLKREGVDSPETKSALELLKSKRREDGTWHLDRKINNLILPMNNKNFGKDFITARARMVVDL